MLLPRSRYFDLYEMGASNIRTALKWRTFAGFLQKREGRSRKPDPHGSLNIAMLVDLRLPPGPVLISTLVLDR
jgi:hypothetical protein